MEAALRNWADRLDLHVHLVNQTAQLGAINVAGPHARDLLAALSDDDLSRDGDPLPGTRRDHRRRRAVPRDRGRVRRGTLLRAAPPPRPQRRAVGRVARRRAHVGHPSARTRRPRRAPPREGALLPGAGHDARRPSDEARARLGGRRATSPRSSGSRRSIAWPRLPLDRKLVGLRFDGEPQRGAPLEVDGRIVGRVTSCAVSDAVGASIGLGWIRAIDGSFPRTLAAGELTATVVADAVL